MSRPSEYADGATGGASQVPPNVYLPQADPPPAYDAYADPAAAHGWQDAYVPADGQDAARGTGETPDLGDTRELPPVPGPVHGRAGAGRHSRRRRAPWRARAAVAVGAVGAVSAAALIAGLGFPDAPSGGTREGGGGRTGPTAAGKPPTVPSTGTGRTPTPVTPLVGRPANSDEPAGPASASPSTEASPAPSESGPDAPSPSAGTPSAGIPTTSAPAVTATPPGRTEAKPGHGPGGTKGPK
ncbi:hypothetical protein [Streptomyces africanus]|uniref:hypothetical protein n=1 Tax=Streptomyces africanus TaxID=231024 RepID=UPI000A38DF8E|nr:hypothetical protein [Streptomyces africanus]